MNPLLQISSTWAETAPAFVSMLMKNPEDPACRYLLCQALLLATGSHIDPLEDMSPARITDKASLDARSTDISSFIAANAKLSRVTLHANAKGLVFFGSRSSLRNVQITCPKGFAIIVFGPNTDIQDTIVNVSHHPGIVIISSGSTASGLNIQVGEPGDYVVVGDDCMFSTGVAIRTSDNHGIYDTTTMRRINHSKPVVLHNHVWIGRQVSITKGSNVARDTILGQGSLVSGSLKAGSVYAGVPAKQLREGVTWDRLKEETFDPLAPVAAYRTRQIEHERTCSNIAALGSKSLTGLSPQHALSRILAADISDAVIAAYVQHLERQSMVLDAVRALEAHALRLIQGRRLPLPDWLASSIARLRELIETAEG